MNVSIGSLEQGMAGKHGVECSNTVHWNKICRDNRALNAPIRFIGTRNGRETGH